MCERRSDVWQKKKTTPQCRLFLFRSVLQVSLPGLVSRKCTGKEKDDTEVPSHSHSTVVDRFPCLSSSVVSVRETNAGSHEEATSRHLLVTP
jgi:hypothetical protein